MTNSALAISRSEVCGKAAMEVEPVFASHVVGQLRYRNATEGYFNGVISDYQQLLTRNRELQVTRHTLRSSYDAVESFDRQFGGCKSGSMPLRPLAWKPRSASLAFDLVLNF